MKKKSKRPFVFVLMPFQDDLKNVYELGIKQACKDAGTTCERVDEEIFEHTVLHQIYKQIRAADFVVSEMSNRNPNVFYETGYAHALGKKVILLTHKEEDIPFDLRSYPHIIYKGDIVFLKSELTKRLKHFINQSPLPPTKSYTSSPIPQFPHLPSQKSQLFIDVNPVLEGRQSMDDCIMLCHSPEYQGWDAEEIRLNRGRKEIRQLEGRFNKQIQTTKAKFRISHKWKYAVLGYTLPLLDENLNRISVDVGYTDFATAAAAYSILDDRIPGSDQRTVFENLAPDFFQDAGECRIDVASHLVPVIPCVDLTVIDSDDKIVLLQRSKYVHFFPETWTPTIEEQMNAIWKGQAGDGTILDAAKRSLREELLGNAIQEIDVSSLKFLALLFNPVAFSLDIVGIIRIGMRAEDLARNIAHRATDPSEHGPQYRLVDLSIDKILQLIFPEASERRVAKIKPTKWHSIARMRLFLTLLWRFGFEEVGRHPIVQKIVSSNPAHTLR